MKKAWFYEILFFQVIIVMVKDKKRCTIKYTMTIKVSFIHYRTCITWTRVKLPVVFEKFDMVYVTGLLDIFNEASYKYSMELKRRKKSWKNYECVNSMVRIPMKLFFLNMPFMVEVVEVINGTCENPEQYCKSALIIPVLVSFKSWVNSQSNKF